jgi:hypothetical protein
MRNTKTIARSTVSEALGVNRRVTRNRKRIEVMLDGTSRGLRTVARHGVDGMQVA